MRYLTTFISLVMLVFFIVRANAQELDHSMHHPEQGRVVQNDTSDAQSDMKSCQKMMEKKGCGKSIMKNKKMEGHHSPMHRYMKLVDHLPEMKAKLELSAEQVERLKKIQADFLKRKADWGADIEKKQIDLNLMLDKEPAASEIRKILKGIMDIKLELKVAGYETVLKMKNVLSKEQKQKMETSCPISPGSKAVMDKKGCQKH